MIPTARRPTDRDGRRTAWPTAEYDAIMADTSESSAELRLSRVNALSQHDLIAVLTYLLARNPETFPPLLDEALSSVSPGSANTGSANTGSAADTDSAGTASTE
jgi:hypothetical protein